MASGPHGIKAELWCIRTCGHGVFPAHELRPDPTDVAWDPACMVMLFTMPLFSLSHSSSRLEGRILCGRAAVIEN